MTEPDLESLLRSPLDEGPEGRSPGVMVLGAALGAIATTALLVAMFGLPSGEQSASPGDGPESTATSQPESSATTGPTAPPADYPEGFTSISDEVAAKPTGIIVIDDHMKVGITLATRRGIAPESAARPLGGRFRLERADGSSVEASRVVYDHFTPGAWSVEFPTTPAPGDRLRMLERWDPEPRTATTEIPFPGTPFVADKVIVLDLGAGTTIQIDGLELGRFLGRLAWSVGGEGYVPAIARVTVSLIEADGSPLGDYGSFGVLLDPTPARDVTDLFWVPGFPVDQDDATSVGISANVQLTNRQPVDAILDLSDLLDE